jgi:hypothetical protein
MQDLDLWLLASGLFLSTEYYDLQHKDANSDGNYVDDYTSRFGAREGMLGLR